VGDKLQLRQERYDAWIKNGALPSDTVVHLVKKSAAKAAAPAGAKKP
jgi:ribosomal protein S16